jgi:hypothetical protein
MNFATLQVVRLNPVLLIIIVPIIAPLNSDSREPKLHIFFFQKKFFSISISATHVMQKYIAGSLNHHSNLNNLFPAPQLFLLKLMGIELTSAAVRRASPGHAHPSSSPITPAVEEKRQQQAPIIGKISLYPSCRNTE